MYKVYFHQGLSKVFSVCCFAGLLSAAKKARIGEQLESIHSKKGLENALMQCQKVTESFEGSEETLRLIRRVEESLRRLMAETD